MNGGLVRISTGKTIQWRDPGHSVNRRSLKSEELLSSSPSRKSSLNFTKWTYPLTQNYYSRKKHSEIDIFVKLRISRVVPWRGLYCLEISRVQHASKITKNNFQWLIFVIISCQRVYRHATARCGLIGSHQFQKGPKTLERYILEKNNLNSIQHQPKRQQLNRHLIILMHHHYSVVAFLSGAVAKAL